MAKEILKQNEDLELSDIREGLLSLKNDMNDKNLDVLKDGETIKKTYTKQLLDKIELYELDWYSNEFISKYKKPYNYLKNNDIKWLQKYLNIFFLKPELDFSNPNLKKYLDNRNIRYHVDRDGTRHIDKIQEDWKFWSNTINLFSFYLALVDFLSQWE